MTSFFQNWFYIVKEFDAIVGMPNGSVLSHLILVDVT